VRRLAIAAVGLAAFVVPAQALAITCPDTTIRVRLDGSDIAFVGRLLSQREIDSGHAYRFRVDQKVKGPIGGEVEVTSTEPLVDVQNRPLANDVAVGVLGTTEGAVYVTGSCSLVDAGALLSVADEVRGQGIKVVIGILILILVLVFSVRRLRQRQARLGSPP
jgi:hypothetical protein